MASKKKIQKINIDTIERKNGFDTFDKLADGVSPDLDPMKVSAIIQQIIDSVNEMAEAITALGSSFDKQNDIIKKIQNITKNKQSAWKQEVAKHAKDKKIIVKANN